MTRYGIGVLAELATARPGTVLGTADGDQQREWRVRSVRRVAKARLAADAEVFDQSGSPRLVLVTCGGAFDRTTHTYADNIVVATPMA